MSFLGFIEHLYFTRIIGRRCHIIICLLIYSWFTPMCSRSKISKFGYIDRRESRWCNLRYVNLICDGQNILWYSQYNCKNIIGQVISVRLTCSFIQMGRKCNIKVSSGVSSLKYFTKASILLLRLVEKAFALVLYKGDYRRLFHYVIGVSPSCVQYMPTSCEACMSSLSTLLL